jgi:hypothetical protein
MVAAASAGSGKIARKHQPIAPPLQYSFEQDDEITALTVARTA